MSVITKIRVLALLTLASCLAWGCRHERFVMSSDSMAPTLKRGDVLTLRKDSAPAEAMDIVLFRREGSEEVWVMRLVALSGEKIHFRDDGVYRNGAVIDLSKYGIEYVSARGPVYQYGVDHEYTVPEGEIFVMGDNLRAAKDSRCIGPVRWSDVIGVIDLKRRAEGDASPQTSPSSKP